MMVMIKKDFYLLGLKVYDLLPLAIGFDSPSLQLITLKW